MTNKDKQRFDITSCIYYYVKVSIFKNQELGKEKEEKIKNKQKGPVSVIKQEYRAMMSRFLLSN